MSDAPGFTGGARPAVRQPAPTGVYDDRGRLIATKHGRTLTVIQNPDTAERMWLDDTGKIYHREPATILGDQRDVDRLNRALVTDSDDGLNGFRGVLVLLAISTFVGVLAWVLI